MGARAWTDEETKLAASLWKEGHDAPHISKAIAEKFGIEKTRAAIIGKLHRDGLAVARTPLAPKIFGKEYAPWKKEHEEMLIAAENAGMPQKDMAAMLAEQGKDISVRALGLRIRKLRSEGRLPQKKRKRAKKSDMGTAKARKYIREADPVKPEHEGNPTLLENTGCKWALSGSGIETRFCGEKRPKGRPYCEKHRAEACGHDTEAA